MECLDICKDKGVVVSGIYTRQHMSAVFLYAIRTMRTEVDPTLAFAGYLKRPEITHAKAMTVEQIKAFKKSLENYNGSFVVKRPCSCCYIPPSARLKQGARNGLILTYNRAFGVSLPTR